MSLAMLASSGVASKLPGGGAIPNSSATSAAKSGSSGNVLSTGEFNPDFSKGGGVTAQLPLLAVLGAGAFVAWLTLKK